MRLLYQGYGETRLLNKCGNGVECAEEQHEVNRRSIVKVVRKGTYQPDNPTTREPENPHPVTRNPQPATRQPEILPYFPSKIRGVPFVLPMIISLALGEVAIALIISY
jgi:hypothetical protein